MAECDYLAYFLQVSFFVFQIKDSVNTAFLLAIIKYRRDPDLKNAVDSVQINVSLCHSKKNKVDYQTREPCPPF
jgi:hypothetical protein